MCTFPCFDLLRVCPAELDTPAALSCTHFHAFSTAGGRGALHGRSSRPLDCGRTSRPLDCTSRPLDCPRNATTCSYTTCYGRGSGSARTARAQGSTGRRGAEAGGDANDTGSDGQANYCAGARPVGGGRGGRAAFYQALKSKVGLAAANAAALRINLNVASCSVVAPPDISWRRMAGRRKAEALALLTAVAALAALAALAAPGAMSLRSVVVLSPVPDARSFAHSPSSPPPPFTQSPFPWRSLVRDGQTSPHIPRLVVPHSHVLHCPHFPPAHSFIIGPAVIKTHRESAKPLEDLQFIKP